MRVGYNFLFAHQCLPSDRHSSFNIPTKGFPKESAKECSINVTWQLLPLASDAVAFATGPPDPINPVDPRTGETTWKISTGVVEDGEAEEVEDETVSEEIVVVVAS
jgi:hypothetical protein